jgi:hypothetical protein
LRSDDWELPGGPDVTLPLVTLEVFQLRVGVYSLASWITPLRAPSSIEK